MLQMHGGIHDLFVNILIDFDGEMKVKKTCVASS